MLVVIDGYNLMGTRRGGRFEAEREELLAALIDYRSRTGHDVILFFDGHEDGGFGSSEVKGGVRLTFTGLGERADDAIMKVLEPGVETAVISSDHEVQAGVWAKGAVAVDSETFMRRFLLSPSSGVDGAEPSMMDSDEEYEEMYASRGKKGNPRKASRKQKALDRILRKL